MATMEWEFRTNVGAPHLSYIRIVLLRCKRRKNPTREYLVGFRFYQGQLAGSGKYSSLKNLPVGPSDPIVAYLTIRSPAWTTVLVP